MAFGCNPGKKSRGGKDLASGTKEGCLCTMGMKHIKDTGRGFRIRTVIIGQVELFAPAPDAVNGIRIDDGCRKRPAVVPDHLSGISP